MLPRWRRWCRRQPASLPHIQLTRSQALDAGSLTATSAHFSRSSAAAASACASAASDAAICVASSSPSSSIARHASPSSCSAPASGITSGCPPPTRSSTASASGLSACGVIVAPSPRTRNVGTQLPLRGPMVSTDSWQYYIASCLQRSVLP
eukprot:2976193-Pleurochrysis_carterae.AAC.2